MKKRQNKAKNNLLWQYGLGMTILFVVISASFLYLVFLSMKPGIAFSTPSGRVVQPQAKPNRHFLLQRKIPQEAPEWDQGIAE